MKAYILAGMIAGGVIGAAATLIAYPYFKPQLDNMLQNGKTCIDAHIDKMLGKCTDTEC